MLQNNFYLTIVFFFTFTSIRAQNIMRDTIYIYEEVVIHDTIYIEKQLDKLEIKTAILTLDTITKKNVLQILDNGKILSIPIENTIVKSNTLNKTVKNKNSYNWEYGIKIDLSVPKNSIFNNQLATGLGAGFFAKHNLLNPKFFIGSSVSFTRHFKSFDLKPNESDSDLSGYYFFDAFPKYISNISNKHNQYSFSTQVYWKINKFSPSFGGFYGLNIYQTTFTGTSGNLPLIFDKEEILTTKTNQIGTFVEINYGFNLQWSIAIKYFSSEINSLKFINNNSEISSNKKGIENGISFQLLYNFSKKLK